jgi:hypothetical protein
MHRFHHRMFPVLLDFNRLEGCVTAAQVKVVPRGMASAQSGRGLNRFSPENNIGPETDSAGALRLMQRFIKPG